MIQIINPFKGLGRCFYYSLEQATETRLDNETFVSTVDRNASYKPEIHVSLKRFMEGKEDFIKTCGIDIPATRIYIIVGKNYHGSLVLPKGTQSIEIFDIKKNGPQVIHYNRNFNRGYGTVCGVPFANEFRSPDNRIEIENIIPRQS